MKENVGKFFEIYASDPAVRGRVEANVEAYPGSYEIREALTAGRGGAGARLHDPGAARL